MRKNIEEVGCKPIKIGELFGGGYQAEVTGNSKVKIGKKNEGE